MLRIRPIHSEDQHWLWEFLHVALWDPPPAPLRPREVLEHPEVRLYVEHWGRPGDVGVLGELPEVASPIGACWLRLLLNQQGFAYVDDQTPQLGIALFPQYQRQGHGYPLLLAALDAARATGYRQVALTVHPENPAIRLYERCGFRKSGLRKTYHLMVNTL